MEDDGKRVGRVDATEGISHQPSHNLVKKAADLDDLYLGPGLPLSGGGAHPTARRLFDLGAAQLYSFLYPQAAASFRAAAAWVARTQPIITR